MADLLSFWKMNGAGNDFVVIDNRDLSRNLRHDQIAALCDRHRGVGADGLLAIEPGQAPADYRMRYYNADGGEAEMCGNGARCFARFANFLANDQLKEVSFDTQAGLITATFTENGVRLQMSEPFDFALNESIEVHSQTHTIDSINTGVPHAVLFVEDLESLDLVPLGRAVRHHARFAPKGTNFNAAKVLRPDSIAIRTYERGVEDETLACGTGMVASALSHALRTGLKQGPVSVKVEGGDVLFIGFEKQDNPENSSPVFHHVTLTGPADLVFSGQIDLQSL